MTYLLAISRLPDGFMCVDRYYGKSFVQELRLKLADGDTADELQDFLEVFRQTGDTGG